MTLKTVWAMLCIIVLSPFQAFAQTDTVEFGDYTWRVTADKAERVTHLGREALALKQGRVWADDANFTDGVISFDAAYHEHQVFVGAGWRADTVSRLEEMYFRGHLNNKPDALQYTPVENRLTAWQIFSGPNALTAVTQRYDTWNQVKIIVEGDRADIYFNSEEPVLHIPDLKTDLAVGAVVLRSTGRQSDTVYFSNLSVRPLASGEGVVGTPKAEAEPPEGLIKRWQVSSAFPESALTETLSLKSKHTKSLTWLDLDVETHGIANLAKVAAKKDGNDTVFVRMNIASAKDQMKELRFGYSDRVRIYLNGKRVYYGNAGWKVRDYRFLGTVGFHDSVGLDLKKGNNELLIGISETFGGWAWAGAIEDRDKIMMEGKYPPSLKGKNGKILSLG